jgi:hypothetical protein
MVAAITREGAQRWTVQEPARYLLYRRGVVGKKPGIERPGSGERSWLPTSRSSVPAWSSSGFGGLSAAKVLSRGPFDVTVVDRYNYHLFQPLLYQVATAALSPADIASPIRTIFRHQRNVSVVLANVSGIDIARNEVVAGGRSIPSTT